MTVGHDTTGGSNPKIHGAFTLSQLAGAGVALAEAPTAEDPNRVDLRFGDGATHVILLGSLDEIDAILDEAHQQTTRLRAQRRAAGTG